MNTLCLTAAAFHILVAPMPHEIISPVTIQSPGGVWEWNEEKQKMCPIVAPKA